MEEDPHYHEIIIMYFVYLRFSSSSNEKSRWADLLEERFCSGRIRDHVVKKITSTLVVFKSPYSSSLESGELRSLEIPSIQISSSRGSAILSFLYTFRNVLEVLRFGLFRFFLAFDHLLIEDSCSIRSKVFFFALF